MLQSPVTSLLRALGPSRQVLIQRNLCRFSLQRRDCLTPMLLLEHQNSGNNNLAKLSQPLSIVHLQQRFASQLSKDEAKGAQTSKRANQIREEAEAEEEEDDILYRRVQIEARCADRAVLDSYEKFVTMAANYLGVTVSRVWEPYRTIKRRTLLRAAFVKKKYRVQYEWRTYYRCLEFKHLTGSTAETFLEYIERNLPESVALKVTRQRIEELPSHLVPPAQSSSANQQ